MGTEEGMMQEFLTNNTVNCNLMSLTGYRTLVILNALLESPKTNDEINDCLLNNQYIKEKFSIDTLRIYINSLRKIGCEITRANKSNNQKYVLLKHPFTYDMAKSQLKAIAKLQRSLHDKVGVVDLIAIDSLLNKLSGLVDNESTKEFLNNISLLKRVDKKIMTELLIYCKHKNQITFLYNSPTSGKKEIEIIADKLEIKSEKLYLWGHNLTHKQYSYFVVERILNIRSIKLSKDNEEFLPSKITYELYNRNNDYAKQEEEKIIEKTDSKLVIELNAKNEFDAIQKILHLGSDCKVISPDSFRTKILNKLKSMEKIYGEV